MAASRTRPGNPDRGWNDPPMFNYDAVSQGPAPPRRHLNKRVAFPTSGVAGPTPGHAVLNPSQGPPIMNPVLPTDIQGTTVVTPQVPVPIGLRDTPLGNQAAPTSPIQLLPPTVDTSTPQTVPVLVPALVPSSPPKVEEQMVDPEHVQLQTERLEELMARLGLTDDTQLLQQNVQNFQQVLYKFRNILTLKVTDEIQRKIEIFQEKWKQGTLSEQVKVKISQLSTALLNEETDKAHHLHLALMVDHIGEVNQWMMGVKRLLQQQQLAHKEREIIAESRQVKDSEGQLPASGCDVTEQNPLFPEKNENVISDEKQSENHVETSQDKSGAVTAENNAEEVIVAEETSDQGNEVNHAEQESDTASNAVERMSSELTS